jgi:hypothetical protein
VESKETALHRKRLEKHVPEGTNTHETTEISDAVFSMRSVLCKYSRVVKEDDYSLNKKFVERNITIVVL